MAKYNPMTTTNSEKLTGLRKTSCRHDDIQFNVAIADHMILSANGVTVRRWIPIEERLPTIIDADDNNCVLAVHKVSKNMYYHWRTVVDNPFDFTHWMRPPMPPRDATKDSK